MDPDVLWTPVGITTVDQHAPYYKADGYWNGAVWMAHQWLYYKTMLDLGRGDDAFRIAQTALEVWKNETDRSYNCCEHFIVASGRGAGWHQFGGLSAPVQYWFKAYYVPGTWTCGFDIWPEDAAFEAGNTRLRAVLRLNGPERLRTTVVACMAPGRAYRATFDGVAMDYTVRMDGVLEIRIPNDGGRGRAGCGSGVTWRIYHVKSTGQEKAGEDTTSPYRP